MITLCSNDDDLSAPISREIEKADFQLEEQYSPNVPTIYHGAPITDKKSECVQYNQFYTYCLNIGKFQAHFAGVRSLEEVNLVILELMKDKKIASATHNIRAYRVQVDGVMVRINLQLQNS
jgi:hypothetical protein